MKLRPSIVRWFDGVTAKAVLFTALVSMCGIFVSCGGNSGQDILASAGMTGEIQEAEDLPINLQVGDEGQLNEDAPSPRPSPSRGEGEGGGDSDSSYSGKVVIKFKDGTDVRLRPEDRDGPFVSLAGVDVSEVNEIIARYNPPSSPFRKGGIEGDLNIQRVTQASEEEVEAWMEWWRKQGVTLHDWNLYYYIEVPDYEDAKELVRELNALSPSPLPLSHQGRGNNELPQQVAGNYLVEYAEIIPIFYLTEVTAPDFSSEQDYLGSAVAGGIGVEDAWAKLDAQFPDIKLRGQHTMVVDQEYDWNFDHEILPIDEKMWEYIYQPLQIGKDVPNNIEHGTAVVGIIAGQGNDIAKGIKGIVPQTAMRVASIELGAGAMGGILVAAEGQYTGSDPLAGAVYTIEVQRKGITTTGASGCSVGDGVNSPAITGCVPLEASKFVFDVIQLSTANGKIIIEGAGNGGVNLNDDNLSKPKDGEYSYFNDNDSGAIMVGASLGADKRKAAWSNCGSRVDVFGWGQGVVTAGYGDKFNPDGADPNVIGPMGADNPKLYTGQFGGTSAATAQIAGIAALIQSYVRQLVFEAGYNGKVVYLDSKQMRTILKNSGQPAVYGQTPNDPNPNCNIGVQPDASLAIDKTNEFLNAGNVLKVVPLNKDTIEDPAGSKGGISYDMDGDGRADLISFSRDHKFYIDLSSIQPPASSIDGYGAWDLILDATPSPPVGEGWGDGAMLFPVVNRYTYYGTRADLSVYDSVNGKWYIKYTAPEDYAPHYWKGIPLPEEYTTPYGKNIPITEWESGPMQWDRVIDYSTDPNWKKYSRPVPGDYDGDGNLDIALQTPDGHWLIDYGGYEVTGGGDILNGVTMSVADGKATVTLVNPIYYEAYDKLGTFDKDVAYLTPAQLAEAPGWAWLPVHFVNPDGSGYWIEVKRPDGINNENQSIAFNAKSGEVYAEWTDWGKICENCDNDTIPIGTSYYYQTPDIGLKAPDGTWNIVDYNITGNILSPQPNGIFGDILCRPIPADYDGDNLDDRVVQCGTNWKIVYSSTNQVREIELNQALDPVPAYVYPGGIKYQDTVDLYNYYKGELGGTKDSTIFDVIPPVGPYFAQCVKTWALDAAYCWDK